MTWESLNPQINIRYLINEINQRPIIKVNECWENERKKIKILEINNKKMKIVKINKIIIK